MPIALKLYMCYGHGLKKCMWFGYNPQIIFVIFSQFFRAFSRVCAELLLQFNTDTFETLQTLRPCFEDMHVVGMYSSDYFFCHFLQFEFSRFSDIFTS